jgi:hypothetical protein
MHHASFPRTWNGVAIRRHGLPLSGVTRPPASPALAREALAAGRNPTDITRLTAGSHSTGAPDSGAEASQIDNLRGVLPTTGARPGGWPAPGADPSDAEPG